MIKSSNLSFCYPGSTRDSLHDLNFTVPKGSLACLLGSNGSGKSTLLALLAGLYRPALGSLEVGGYPADKQQREIRAICALVPQNPDLYLLGSTLREDLYLGLPPRQDKAEEKARAERICAAMGLGDLLDEPVQTLSFGQRRKASLASALMRRPALLLLDEPFSGLDFSAQLHLRSLLTKLRQQGTTQVIATHDLDMTGDLANSFFLLKDGLLFAKGTQKEVFPCLEKADVRPPCWWLHGACGPLFP